MLLFVDDFVVRTLSREAHLAKKGAELNAATAGAPAMLRRRLTPLGKLAVSAIAELKPQENEPMVFASSWGDLARSFALLESLCSSAEMSPAAFALSVHNAIGATTAIWLKDRSAHKAVCGGKTTASAGFIECALALRKAPSVLLARYEPVMPEAWQNPDAAECSSEPAVWAMRLTAQKTPVTIFELAVSRLSAASEADKSGSIAAEIDFFLGEMQTRKRKKNRQDSFFAPELHLAPVCNGVLLSDLRAHGAILSLCRLPAFGCFRSRRQAARACRSTRRAKKLFLVRWPHAVAALP